MHQNRDRYRDRNPNSKWRPSTVWTQIFFFSTCQAYKSEPQLSPNFWLPKYWFIGECIRYIASDMFKIMCILFITVFLLKINEITGKVIETPVWQYFNTNRNTFYNIAFISNSKNYIRFTALERNVEQKMGTSRQVIPTTQMGACADWATSNRLYSSVWFLWWANRSNSSNTKMIGLLLWSPEKKPQLL